ALLATNRDLVLLDQLADVLESHWSLVEVEFVFLCDGVQHVSSGNRLSHTCAPAARFEQVIEEKSDHVIWLDEGAVSVNNAEAIGVAVGADADRGAGLFHFGATFVQQFAFRLGGVSSEENVTVIMNCCNGDPVFAQQDVRVSARRSPE